MKPHTPPPAHGPYDVKQPVVNQSWITRKAIEKVARRGPTQEEAQAEAAERRRVKALKGGKQ